MRDPKKNKKTYSWLDLTALNFRGSQVQFERCTHRMHASACRCSSLKRIKQYRVPVHGKQYRYLNYNLIFHFTECSVHCRVHTVAVTSCIAYHHHHHRKREFNIYRRFVCILRTHTFVPGKYDEQMHNIVCVCVCANYCTTHKHTALHKL